MQPTRRAEFIPRSSYAPKRFAWQPKAVAATVHASESTAKRRLKLPVRRKSSNAKREALGGNET